VGVFDVDRLLHFPDFRSHERTFQLITQVSGRAGRKQAAGRVLVQTANPQHPVLERVLAHDYLGFYRAELAERSAHGYPPFTRLVRLTIRGEELGAVQQAAAELASRLRQGLGPARVLGPEAPVVERIRNLYLRDVLVKIERDKIDLKKAKAFIKATMQGLGGSPKFKTLQIIPDVDPV
jgi:primosomal protein N' (replication factor Y)